MIALFAEFLEPTRPGALRTPAAYGGVDLATPSTKRHNKMLKVIVQHVETSPFVDSRNNPLIERTVEVYKDNGFAYERARELAKHGTVCYVKSDQRETRAE
jgi:hypothetical protein